MSLWRLMTRLPSDAQGATVPEYALMLALIVVVCLGSVQALGNAVNVTFQNAVSNQSTSTKPAPVSMPGAGSAPKAGESI